MNLLLIIAVSLSMDAFSLSLAYGTLGMSNTDKAKLSFITGIFHFFMPLFGLLFGKLILKYFIVDMDIIVMLILGFIGINMIMSSFKNDEVLEKPKFFLFALAVSLDSFSVGITLTEICKNIVIGPLMFALVSFAFTLIGLILGNKIERLVGKLSTIIGGIVLVFIGVLYVLG